MTTSMPADANTKAAVMNAIFLMRKALEYYADVRNYGEEANKPVVKDGGELARKALGMLDKL